MDLKIKSLSRVALSEQRIQEIYDNVTPHPAADNVQLVRELCLSHERLRAELSGAEIIIKELNDHGL